MIKLQTPVVFQPSRTGIGFSDSVAVLGSCFADNIGQRMKAAGFDVCVNPFGTLYNPVSIVNAAARLQSGIHFTEKDCVGMGAGAGLVCSFNHHTSFARPDAAQFLSCANTALEEASSFWKRADKVIITLGTAFCYRNIESGEVVANCLKRPAAEFAREMLDVRTVSMLLDGMVTRYPDKHFILTVSPIRHMSDGAHANQLSKSTLLLAVENMSKYSSVEYFPAFEIMMDELRDYRFYAEDMVHPTSQAADYIWERFCDFAVSDKEKETLKNNIKAWRQSQHRPLH
ncbi:MAG: GSCFA domain-containing protein [Bacteroidia bacterium]|nr:GSCFA domain-containing protein [Bacteroidia bacterium]